MQKNKPSFFRKSILFVSALLVSASLSTFLGLFPSSTVGAVDNSKIEKEIKAYQYYKNLFEDNTCNLKDDVKGSDINKYNFYNVWGTQYFYVGLIAKSGSGSYNCANTDSDTKQFTVAAAQALGLNSSDPGELLCQLGYKQTVAGSNATKTSCANGSTKTGGEDAFHIDGAGSNVNKYLLDNKLKNKKPGWSDAAAYWSTLQDFFKGCSAKTASSGTYGGSVANIRIVDNSGNIVTKGYTYDKGDGKPFAAVNDINSKTGGDDCPDLIGGLSANASDKYVKAYQNYVLEDACSKKYSASAQKEACVKGAQNKSNINYCTNTYTGADKKDARLACYAGQGNQGLEDCRLRFNTPATMAACVKGAQNANSATYCASQYPAPDNLRADGSTGPDTNKTNRDACIEGQKTPAEGGIQIDAGDNTATPPGEGEGEDDTTSCAIPGVGWIICPVVSFLADIADNAFSFLSDNFLQVNVQVVETDGDTYKAWVVMRNIANIAFVIAFLIIIFAQLSGQGISNYGIKKTLPRLIVSAILVNISFLVCQLAVDISNILGVSLKQFLTDVGGSIPIAAPGASESGNWAGIAVAVLAGGAIAWGLGISVLLPFLIGAVIALVMIFLILVVRQVLIILLVVISPLAFVAFLLPNTEQWFTKWRKTFVALLLVFPIIGLLFGAASLASAVLKNVYAGSGDLIGQIIAEGVLVLPLLMLPALLKGSLNAVGSIGGKLNGMSSKLSGAAKSKTANTGLMKNFAARKAERRASMSTGTYRGKNPISKLRSTMNRGLNNNSLFNAATGGYGATRTLAGQAQARKDASEAMAMFNGDDVLAQAWAESGGSINNVAPGVLSVSQAAQFKLMANAGHATKATSFLAASQFLSDSGKGSATAVSTALGHAKSRGASDTDIGGAWQAAQAAYRKSGRGDAVGEMSAFANANGGAPATSATERAKATPANLAAARQKGWGEVDPSSVHREGIKATRDASGKITQKSDGYKAYESHLASSRDAVGQALAGYDRMEARAKGMAHEAILESAQARQSAETGATSTITNIQEAKTYFNIK